MSNSSLPWQTLINLSDAMPYERHEVEAFGTFLKRDDNKDYRLTVGIPYLNIDGHAVGELMSRGYAVYSSDMLSGLIVVAKRGTPKRLFRQAAIRFEVWQCIGDEPAMTYKATTGSLNEGLEVGIKALLAGAINVALAQ
ncbi:hypothetical protein [Ochrobactrum sp. BTU1]|uniref:hypothetical protein n=1 Tax=Ochrobactrum sp. BTU1 TaxID=2840456 RepID=UPI001C056E5F|nr:hypothetical protein KMS41_05160 [Ochrobactrum sp. BTU1]